VSICRTDGQSPTLATLILTALLKENMFKITVTPQRSLNAEKELKYNSKHLLGNLNQQIKLRLSYLLTKTGP